MRSCRSGRRPVEPLHLAPRRGRAPETFGGTAAGVL